MATYQQIIDALVPSGAGFNSMAGFGTPLVVTFSFMEVLPGYFNSADHPGFETTNEAQRDNIRSALQAWANISGLVLVEVPDSLGGDVRVGSHSFSGTDYEDSAAYAYFSQNELSSAVHSEAGDIFFDSEYFSSPSNDAWADIDPDQFTYLAILHEIGHAIGLKHPFENGAVLPVADDSVYNTVMSYDYGSYPYPTTPQSYDIMAVTYIYGEANAAEVLGLNFDWNPLTYTLTLTGSASDDDLVGTNVNDTVFGEAGNDRLFGLAGDDSLDGGTGADMLLGGNGNDRLTGGAGNDNGGGGGGFDTAVYSGSHADYTVSLVGNTLTITDNNSLDGDDGIDVFSSIERVEFVDETITYQADDFSDGLATSGAISIDGTVSGSVNFDGDRDWFAVSLLAGHEYQIDLKGSLSGSGSLGDPYFYGIYDAVGTLIPDTENDDIDPGVYQESRLTFVAPQSGTYYLSAGAWSFYTGTYLLGIDDVTSDDFSGDDSTEGVISVGTSSWGVIEGSGDQDWFRVSLVAGFEYQIDMYGVTSGSGKLQDPDIVGVYTALGELVPGSSNNDITPGAVLESRATFVAPSSGTFYIAAAGNGDSFGDYRVALSNVTLDDYSADTNTLGVVNTEDPTAGLISVAGDDDWFAISLVAGQSYQFTLHGHLDGNGQLLNTWINGIYDSSGVLINGTINYDSPAGGTDAMVVFRPAVSGTFYISANAVGNSIGGYHLVAETDDGTTIVLDEPNETFTNYLDRRAGPDVLISADQVTFTNSGADLNLPLSGNYQFAIEVSGSDVSIVNQIDAAILGGVNLGALENNSFRNFGYLLADQGVVSSGSQSLIENRGTIQSDGVIVSSGPDASAAIMITGGGGLIENDSNAVISGYMSAIKSTLVPDGAGGVGGAADLQIQNHGSIIGHNDDAIRLSGGGFILNWGIIDGVVDNGYGTDGVSGFVIDETDIGAGEWATRISNASGAEIHGARAGAALFGGANVSNGGLISGDGVGLMVGAQESGFEGRVQITNSGIIRDLGNPNNYDFNVNGNYLGTLGAGIFLTGYLHQVQINNFGLIEGTHNAIENLTSTTGITVINNVGGIIRGDSDDNGYGSAIYSQRKEDFPLYLTNGDGSLQMGGSGNPIQATDGSGSLIWDVPLGVLFRDQIINHGHIDGFVNLGLGNDSYLGGDGTNTGGIFGGDGDDTIETGPEADSLDGGEGADTLDGGGGADYLRGDAGDDILWGGEGDDNLVGGAGADIHNGGPGTDTAHFVSSPLGVVIDLLAGTATGGDAQGDTFVGVENLTGSQQSDTLSGDDGANSLRGGSGDDSLYGRGGEDVLYGESDNDHLEAGAGMDALYGGSGNDTLIGGSGSDVLYGGADNDVLSGNRGEDTLNGGPGADVLSGNGGRDILSYEGDTAGIVVDLLVGIGFGGNAEGDTFTSINDLVGGDGNDVLSASGSANLVEGGDGDDTIYLRRGADEGHGGEGNDTIDGSAGIDTIYGEAGNDTLSGGSAADMIYGGDGDDYIDGGVGGDYLKGEGDNDTILGKTGNDRIIGNAGDDILYGQGNSDEIFGGSGSDILEGGSGNDKLYGGSGADTFQYTSTIWGNDTIYDFEDGIDLINMGGTGLEFADLNITSDGTDTLITASDGSTINLLGVTSGIDESDFGFGV